MIEHEGNLEDSSNKIGEQIAGYLDKPICDDPVFDHMTKLMALSKLSAMVSLKGGISYEDFSGMLKNHFKILEKKMKNMK